MTFSEIASLACAKVKKEDNFALINCLKFVKARDREIYESYNWKAAQTIVTRTTDVNTQVDTLEVPEASHVLSVRVNGVLLDPVATSYVFESSAIDFDNAGKPKFYDEFYSATTQVPSIRFYPPLEAVEGESYEVVILCKAAYNTAATSPAIPHASNALIAYTVGDMWEYLQNGGKAQVKFGEAKTLLETAQQSDTPPALKSRMTTNLTATGNSLAELTDSVCNIIGKFDPDTRVSVKERIRRNYQMVADAALWPELTVTAKLRVTGSGEQVILPHYFDRVVAVRTDEYADGVIRTPYQIKYRDVPLWFGLDPCVFEQVGVPCNYQPLPPIGVTKLPEFAQPLVFSLSAVNSNGAQQRYPHVGESISVFVKGMTGGIETYETVDVKGAVIGPRPDAPYKTTASYDTPITVSKPASFGTLYVYGAVSKTNLLILPPQERERKHLRIWLQPNQLPKNTATSQSDASTLSSDQTLAKVLVFGKQKVSQLLDDNDTCQLRNVENILINASAADMLFQMGQPDRGNALKLKADAAMQELIDGETKQAEYAPRILPYTEPDYGYGYGNGSFDPNVIDLGVSSVSNDFTGVDDE